MRISDGCSDVCSSDLRDHLVVRGAGPVRYAGAAGPVGPAGDAWRLHVQARPGVGPDGRRPAAAQRRLPPADRDGDRGAGGVRRGDAGRRTAHRPTGTRSMSTNASPPPSALALSDPGLLRTRGLVGGQWRDADGGGTCEVTNPATGAVLGTIPDMGAGETRRDRKSTRVGKEGGGTGRSRWGPD